MSLCMFFRLWGEKKVNFGWIEVKQQMGKSAFLCCIFLGIERFFFFPTVRFFLGGSYHAYSSHDKIVIFSTNKAWDLSRWKAGWVVGLVRHIGMDPNHELDFDVKTGPGYHLLN